MTVSKWRSLLVPMIDTKGRKPPPSRRRARHDSPAEPIAPVGSVAPIAGIRTGRGEGRDPTED
jgi:hypothetical protein